MAPNHLYVSLHRQYGMLLANIQNNHTRSADQYPKTMTKAYEMIVNYKNLKATTRFDRQDHGMSFYNEDKEDNNSNTNKQQQSQQGGRCGHGHGHSSRWSQGGEGREYGQGNENGNIHINEEEGNKEDDTGQNNIMNLLFHTQCLLLQLVQPIWRHYSMDMGPYCISGYYFIHVHQLILSATNHFFMTYKQLTTLSTYSATLAQSPQNRSNPCIV